MRPRCPQADRGIHPFAGRIAVSNLSLGGRSRHGEGALASLVFRGLHLYSSSPAYLIEVTRVDG